MKTNIIIFLIIVIATAYTTYMLDYTQTKHPRTTSQQQQAPKLSKPVPAFTFTDTNGTSYNITDFKGKTVFLNFWASWCTPCLKEFPEFIKTANTHKEGAVIIALSSDHDPEAMNRFLKKMEKQYTGQFPAKNMIIALDQNAQITQGLFQTHRLPETIMIDQSGNMVEKIIGASWTAEDLGKKIKARAQK